MSSGMLGDVRVAEFAFNLAGPYCAMLLGDLGAEVVKVERPGRGDSARAWGTWSDADRSVLYLAANRNKSSVTLDLHTADGLRAARRLIATSDVLIESMSPGVMERLGLGFETAAEINPRIIYVSISGYGQSGPLASEGGFDSMVQALTGLMDMTGPEGQPPSRIPVSSLDYMTGTIAFGGVMACLLRRGKCAPGDGERNFAQRIDASLYDAAINMVGPFITDAAVSGRVQGRSGGELHYVYPYGVFGASDGYFCLGVGSDNIWRKFCDAFGLLSLVDDARYVRNEGRVAHRAELREELQRIFDTMPVEEILARARGFGVPATPVLTVDSNLKSEHLHSRKGLDYVDLVASDGRAPIAATPLRVHPPLGRQEPMKPPPLLGEDSAAVLMQLGYSTDEVVAMGAATSGTGSDA